MCRQCKQTLAWLITTMLFFAIAIALVAGYVPTEATMGPIQKIFTCIFRWRSRRSSPA
jgi:hypothetical protein